MSLKPWREVASPHPDVAAGRYQQAEFAADLAQVARGEGELEYRDPVEFFARTYLTEGMGRLLVTALERLSGKGGEPVVQLKTAFGGGKTHTMLALFHLLGGKAPVEQLAGVDEILKQANINDIPAARLAVIVGTDLNPTKTRLVQGVTVRTLWGHIAAQLGGKDAYSLIEEADDHGVAPGADILSQIFNEFGPAVVLIDELVSYARKIYNANGLTAGSFDSNLSFIQELTEAAKRSKRSIVVASIPESEKEIGGEGGQAALVRIEHIFKRLETIWKPVSATEGFEIVRRRLFTPIKDEAARDEVCRAFSRLYDENPADFPQECREVSYVDRLRAAYPIHPELFDRLYDDWSSLESFQRTRGVLRLMAAAIHELWDRNDRSLLILPGIMPLDAQRVKDELLGYLSEGWNAIVDKDVDGERSEPRAIDESSPRFGEFLAARRVARTIFLGSAPSVSQQAVRGIEDVRVRLGVTQPGESVAVFNDAIGRLSDRLTYLYSSNRRYWFDAHPNLRRTMEDRAGKLEPAEVEAEVVRRLRQIRERGDFKGVHVCSTSGDTPDDKQEARLVILPPSTGHRARSTDSPALVSANEILDKRGSSPRTYRNMLLFVAADTEQYKALEQETRRYLAWKSIVKEVDMLNLDAHQRREAEQGVERSNETAGIRLNDAYCWLLVPTQDGTNPMEWEQMRIAGGQENPVAKAAKKIDSSAQLIKSWSPDLLQRELDRWLWPDEPHITIKRLWECLSTYLYLTRLRDADVLLATIRDGVRSRDFFGYATSVTEDGRYRGLQFGSAGGSIYLDDQSVLVKPDVAEKQQQAETTVPLQTNDAATTNVKPGAETTINEKGETFKAPTTSPLEPLAASLPTRFHGTIALDATRLARDAGQVAEEVIQHLASIVGSNVEITLEIQATVPKGVPDNTVRIVTENCRTLKFNSFGFEED
jgi:predicted AAA+ superfamily ATPase